METSQEENGLGQRVNDGHEENEEREGEEREVIEESVDGGQEERVDEGQEEEQSIIEELSMSNLSLSLIEATPEPVNRRRPPPQASPPPLLLSRPEYVPGAQPALGQSLELDIIIVNQPDERDDEKRLDLDMP